MIRPIQSGDRAKVLDVAQASGLFQDAELDVLGSVFDEAFSVSPKQDQLWFGDDEDGALQSIAYCGPELMADRVWNLYLIAVLPGAQGGGRGGAMLAHVEQALREREQRILIVETAGLDEFEPQRRFYSGAGYENEGTIRDYYADGVDKVVFRKRLDTPG